MFFSLSFPFLLLAFSQMSVAQKASSTSSAPYPTHTIAVGEHGHVFTPESTTAEVGDIVEFRFFPLNHSVSSLFGGVQLWLAINNEKVAKAEFKSPCIPYEITGAGKQGFWSGFFPLNVIATPASACVDKMVGVVNPNTTHTLDIQKQFAANASFDFSPGESFPPEVKDAIPGATQTGSASSSTATVVAASHHDSLGTGAIVGIVIGTIAVLLLAGALIYVCGRQQTIGEIIQQHKPRSSASYQSSQISMASPSTCNVKSAIDHFTCIGQQKKSSHAEYYERPEQKRYQILRPGRCKFMPPMSFKSTPGHYSQPETFVSPKGYPITYGGPTSPEAYQRAYQHFSPTEVPISMKIHRGNSLYGPHELPASLNHDRVPPYPGHELPRNDTNPGNFQGHGTVISR
ncbi:hypothetical protein HYALB_00003784 [Hymenoscyphus albidus]|uniref:Uncharacterized protein n=1 Tax=Hymenoscyphus albidus TaxID=595503 RepID=A0A9N9Q5V3_9HELO|nr:hypothetical protein HYALB_00003784 [Hymenoscyphus albidus]